MAVFYTTSRDIFVVAIFTALQENDVEQEGDVLGFFPDKNFIGQSEGLAFTWMRVTDVPNIVLANQAELLDDESPRYSIPLEKVALLAAQSGKMFNLAKARDPLVQEQPFVAKDVSDNINHFTAEVLSMDGIIYDKFQKEFLNT